MSKKLYVGGLSYSTTEDELSDLFNEYGKVLTIQIIMDRMSGRSKGFGFIEMEDDDAISAIAALNGAVLGERKITVNEARPMEPRVPLYMGRIKLAVNPGDAPPEVVAEILADLSKLFRSVSGKGMEYRFSEAQAFNKALAYE